MIFNSTGILVKTRVPTNLWDFTGSKITGVMHLNDVALVICVTEFPSTMFPWMLLVTNNGDVGCTYNPTFLVEV